MKILEIVKNHLYNIDGTCSIGIVNKNKLDEAIAKLEALQAPKSCDGCVYQHDTAEYHNKCEDCVRYGTSWKEDNYELKDKND